jgi:hypothetical protein
MDIAKNLVAADRRSKNGESDFNVAITILLYYIYAINKKEKVLLGYSELY